MIARRWLGPAFVAMSLPGVKTLAAPQETAGAAEAPRRPRIGLGLAEQGNETFFLSLGIPL